MKNNYLVLYLFFLFFSSCSTPAHLERVETKQYRFDSTLTASIDSSVWKTIVPYKLRMDTEMNVVVGKTFQSLTKDQPEGLLGNFVADLSLIESRKHYYPQDNKQIDFCFLNNGGLRASLPEGIITRRNIFEVMPFENELIVLSTPGTGVNKLLKYIVNKGGVPISGLRFKMKNREVFDVTINNVPFDSTKIYKIVTSDYLANGGDDLTFLAEIKEREYVQLKLRDAILEYCLQLKAEGKLIDPKLDYRIKYE